MRSVNEYVADDTNVGETEDRSGIDDEDETISWVNDQNDANSLFSTEYNIENDSVIGDHDDDNSVATKDSDDLVVEETQFEYDNLINENEVVDDDVEVDDTERSGVDELENSIRKKVQMKIEPMKKEVVRSDIYKSAITQLIKKNVVTLRKLKRDREERTNEFLKKKLYTRLVEMEQREIVDEARVAESRIVQGK